MDNVSTTAHAAIINGTLVTYTDYSKRFAEGARRLAGKWEPRDMYGHGGFWSFDPSQEKEVFQLIYDSFGLSMQRYTFRQLARPPKIITIASGMVVYDNCKDISVDSLTVKTVWGKSNFKATGTMMICQGERYRLVSGDIFFAGIRFGKETAMEDYPDTGSNNLCEYINTSTGKKCGLLIDDTALSDTPVEKPSK
jgi:hypothetical protein